MKRHEADGRGGRLVTMYRFTGDWSDESEMKSSGGDHVTLCLSGNMTLYQEQDDGKFKGVPLSAGEFVVTSPSRWITADVKGATSMLMITPFEGTEVRPRGSGSNYVS